MQTHELQCGNARLRFSEYGAHILSWRSRGCERLYLSSKAVYESGSPIRGGIPIIFPQFSDRGSLPKHGFARTRTWQLIDKKNDHALLRLDSDADTQAFWPFAFTLELVIRLLPDALELALMVRNTSSATFAFTAALHTYFAVEDIGDIAIRELQGKTYCDAPSGRTLLGDSEALCFNGEVDRIYADTNAVDLVGTDTLAVRAHAFKDSVIWNPWLEKASRLSDMGMDEWRCFVCIESGTILQPVMLLPAQSWIGSVVYKLGK